MSTQLLLTYIQSVLGYYENEMATKDRYGRNKLVYHLLRIRRVMMSDKHISSVVQITRSLSNLVD